MWAKTSLLVSAGAPRGEQEGVLRITLGGEGAQGLGQLKLWTRNLMITPMPMPSRHGHVYTISTDVLPGLSALAA